MRISSFAKVSALSLLAVSVILTALAFWNLQKLSASSEQLQNYSEIKQKASIDFVRTINNYLDGGDMLDLNKAKQQLSDLKNNDLADLDQSITEASLKAANDLLVNLDNKYRALGKLSGNELALLHNAERQMNDYAEMVSDYGIDAINLGKPSGLAYVKVAADLFDGLQTLSIARETYFASATEHDLSRLKQAVDSLNISIGQLLPLPLIGIYQKIEVDEFSLGEAEVALDKAEEFKPELSSLIKRYPAEVERSARLISQRATISQQLKQDVESIEKSIVLGEDRLNESIEQAFSQARGLVFLMTIILVIFAIANVVAQRLLILQPVRQLRDAFLKLVSSNDFDPIQVRNKNTELGEIALYFNQLLENLAGDGQRKQQQLEVVSNALAVMDEQLHQINVTNETTDDLVSNAKQSMEQLAELTDQLNHISTEVEGNAKETQNSMSQSQTSVKHMMQVTDNTSKLVSKGLSSLQHLNSSVENVSNILEVIRNIADQTNLLALNAAIESARAGEHGRGFAVVADEVRQLSHKTQQQITEISQLLEQLNTTSTELTSNISHINKASENQQVVARDLLDSTAKVRDKANSNSNVANKASDFASQQRHHVSGFMNTMQNVKRQVEEARALSNFIKQSMQEQSSNIAETLQ